MNTAVMRQSSIFGTRKFGIEDQDWVAWSTIAALRGNSITIYGDGHQIRNLLLVGDLIAFYGLCIEKAIAGGTYNASDRKQNRMGLGGGLRFPAEELKVANKHGYSDWRAGDQNLFYCGIDRAQREFGWHPGISVHKELAGVYDLAAAHLEVFDHGLLDRAGKR